MLNLNLLPPKEKEEFSQEIKRRFLIFYSLGPLFILLIFILLLLAIYFYLKIYLQTEQTLENSLRSSINTQKFESLEAKIKENNTRLKNIIKIKASISPLAPFLKEFFDNLPSEFVLENLSYGAGSFSANGSASQKSDVLKLERSLRDNPKVSNLKFPIENYLNLKEITFNFKIKK